MIQRKVKNATTLNYWQYVSFTKQDGPEPKIKQTLTLCARVGGGSVRVE